MTSTEIIAAFSALLILFVLFWFWRQDRIERRQFKEFMNRTPSATRKYPSAVDRKLTTPFDEKVVRMYARENGDLQELDENKIS
jgi:hypothetical protein